MIQEILDSVPTELLGRSSSDRSSQPPQNAIPWVFALRLIIPLTMGAMLLSAQPEQRQAAREALQTIGINWGIKEAVKEKPQPVKLPAELAWFNDWEDDDSCWHGL